METGKPHTTYRDITHHIDETVQTNEWGWAPFRTCVGKVSVWVEKKKLAFATANPGSNQNMEIINH